VGARFQNSPRKTNIREQLTAHSNEVLLSFIFGFFLSLLVWLLVPYLSGFISFELGLLFFLACTRLGVCTVIIAG
jgi:NADH:ubiquinone oxidoreductase subunit H